MIKYGIVSTIANEIDNLEKYINALVKSTKSYDVTIFLVFDKICTDGSYQLSLALENKFLNLKTLFCKNSTCPTDSYFFGFNEAFDNGCDWIIDINGGFRHNPTEIIRFIRAIQGQTKFVLGSRFTKKTENSFSNFQRYFLSYYGTKVSNKLLNMDLSDLTSGFHLMHKDCIKHLNEKKVKSKYHFLQTEMRYLLCKKFVYKVVPISYSSSSKSLKIKVIIEAMFLLLYYSFVEYFGNEQ